MGRSGERGSRISVLAARHDDDDDDDYKPVKPSDFASVWKGICRNYFLKFINVDIKS